jgi:hypothetical protein
MTRATEFIVMTAAAAMPASVRARYGKVAVCEVIAGVRPKMISERAKGMVRICQSNRISRPGPALARVEPIRQAYDADHALGALGDHLRANPDQDFTDRDFAVAPLTGRRHSRFGGHHDELGCAGHGASATFVSHLRPMLNVAMKLQPSRSMSVTWLHSSHLPFL